MIKNKKATAKGSIYHVYAPDEDMEEVCRAQSYLDLSINVDFVCKITNKKLPIFHNTHKPLENAIIKQLRRVCQ